MWYRRVIGVSLVEVVPEGILGKRSDVGLPIPLYVKVPTVVTGHEVDEGHETPKRVSGPPPSTTERLGRSGVGEVGVGSRSGRSV